MKFLYWTPRILAILFIAFLTLFSFDVFTPGGNLGEMLLGFLIHNIPVFFLIVVLIIAWKRPLVGGIIFTLLALLFILRSVFGQFEPSLLIITTPPLLVGILFFINAYKKASIKSNGDPASSAG